MFDFGEQVVVVTGGASGIGRDTCEAFARAGAHVVVADVDAEQGEHTAQRCRAHGTDSLFVSCDVSDDASVDALFALVMQRFGRLDCAFNNAGIEGVQTPIDALTMEAWHRVLDVNLTGVFRCLRHEARIMRAQRRGAIVNCSSILGRVGLANTAAYTASKHGLIGLTKVAALDLASDGVRVNAVLPAFIETPMLERAGFTTDPAMRAAAEAMHPLGRLGQGSEIADAVLWLCSAQSSFVTGHPLLVDGGYVVK